MGADWTSLGPIAKLALCSLDTSNLQRSNLGPYDETFGAVRAPSGRRYTFCTSVEKDIRS
jgi:hypothetical protein